VDTSVHPFLTYNEKTSITDFLTKAHNDYFATGCPWLSCLNTGWFGTLQVLNKNGIRYRYTDKFKVSRTYITTYCGGSTVSQFAPNQDQYIWFDDFQSGSGDGSSCGASAPSTPPSTTPTPATLSPPTTSVPPNSGGSGSQGAPTGVLQPLLYAFNLVEGIAWA
jgi:hypothetical protein